MSAPPPPPLLELRSLAAAAGDRTLVAGVALTLAPGDIAFVRGPSGVGKSRLLRAIAALDPLAAVRGW